MSMVSMRMPGQRWLGAAASFIGMWVRDDGSGRLLLSRESDRFSYVPSDPARREERCREVYYIQVQGLAKRLQSAGSERVVIGISGGWTPRMRCSSAHMGEVQPAVCQVEALIIEADR